MADVNDQIPYPKETSVSRSIVETLYYWMHSRRIESEVATEMGIPVATLSAKLSPARPQAKLGADELVPLFEAIRKIGYENELQGVIYRFVRELKGEDLQQTADEDLVPQMFSLLRSMGILAQIADGISRNDNVAELEKMRTMLSTEVLPVVLQMESILTSRIHVLHPPKSISVAEAKLATSNTQG
jgi:hypothetical protein